MKEPKLTAKQRRFCEEYVVDWNATRAAIAAGYSEKTAKEIASENLTKPNIQTYISKIQKELEKQAGMSALRGVKELMKIAFSNFGDYMDSWDSMKDFETLTEAQRAAIAELASKKSIDEEGNLTTISKIKLHDKLKALDMLNKVLGYNAPDKHEHTGKDGASLFDNKTDEELLEEIEVLKKIVNREN